MIAVGSRVTTSSKSIGDQAVDAGGLIRCQPLGGWRARVLASAQRPQRVPVARAAVAVRLEGERLVRNRHVHEHGARATGRSASHLLQPFQAVQGPLVRGLNPPVRDGGRGKGPESGRAQGVRLEFGKAPIGEVLVDSTHRQVVPTRRDHDGPVAGPLQQGP